MPQVMGVDVAKVLEIAAWAEEGMKNPNVESFKHGGFLADLGGGRYTADFFGFAAVGHLGDPAKALELFRKPSEESAQALFGISEGRLIEWIFVIGSLQDGMDVGTPAIIERLREACGQGRVEAAATA